MHGEGQLVRGLRSLRERPGFFIVAFRVVRGRCAGRISALFHGEAPGCPGADAHPRKTRSTRLRNTVVALAVKDPKQGIFTICEDRSEQVRAAREAKPEKPDKGQG
jgi:hypothetical protein